MIYSGNQKRCEILIKLKVNQFFQSIRDQLPCTLFFMEIFFNNSLIFAFNRSVFHFPEPLPYDN